MTVQIFWASLDSPSERLVRAPVSVCGWVEGVWVPVALSVCWSVGFEFGCGCVRALVQFEVSKLAAWGAIICQALRWGNVASPTVLWVEHHQIHC